MKLKNIPFPKEYGSWGILLTSCVIGASVTYMGLTLMSFLYILGISLLFMAKAPLGTFARKQNKLAFVFTSVYLVAGLSLLLPALLEIGLKNILALTIIPALTLMVYAVAAHFHKERAVTVEFFAMATLTLPVLFFPVIYAHKITLDSVLIWSFSFLYFSASIFKVKMLIFEKQVYKISNIAYLLTVFIFVTILVYLRIQTWLLFILFSPLLDNFMVTFFHYENKKHLRLVGIIELIKGIAFAIILIFLTRTTIKI